jgi:hypothetical protein
LSGETAEGFVSSPNRSELPREIQPLGRYLHEASGEEVLTHRDFTEDHRIAPRSGGPEKRTGRTQFHVSVNAAHSGERGLEDLAGPRPGFSGHQIHRGEFVGS